MSADDVFFVARKGAVYACFLDGRPVVPLGPEEAFWSAIDAFAAERFPGQVTPDSPPPGQSSPRQPEIAPTPPAPAPVRNVNERTERRHGVSIVGRVFASGGSREAVIADLSTTGARFEDLSSMRLSPGAHVTIKLGTVGPVPAVVRWTRGREAGIQFDSPLQPYVLDHIRQQFGRTR